MRKAFRHTGVLMMLGVVALGLIGAAYTLWYQNLSLTTNVSTGSLTANWSFHPWSAGTSGEGTFGGSSLGGFGKPVVAILTSNESLLNQGASHILGSGGTGTGSARFTYGNFNPPTDQGTGTTTIKPITNCTGSLTPSTSGGPSSMTLNLGGLFPFAGCEFVVDISAAGTVPMHIAIQSQTVKQCTNNTYTSCTPVPAGENLPWTRGVVAADSSNAAECLALFNADWNGPTPPAQINDAGGNPVQIHPQEDLKCAFMLVLDENWRTGLATDPNSFVPDQNLSFQVTTNYTAYQWNESPSSSTLSSIAP